MTKTIRHLPGAQGDFILIPIKGMPTNVKASTPHGRHFIVAHSETGHNHVIEKVRAEVFEAADDAFVAYIRTLGDGAEIVHQRNHDTHETIALQPNSTYEVRRQREYVPEGFRRAAD